MKRTLKISFVVFVILGLFLIFGYNKKEDSYRNIKVVDFEGNVTIERSNGKVLKAYEDMKLQNGDKIEVDKKGYLRLILDDDKFIYAEENTVFSLVAEGTSEDSRTRISLKYGTIVNELQNALSKESSYEVETPNSTMSVRGTVFALKVTKYGNGEHYTTLNVFEGSVNSQLLKNDGTLDDKLLVEAGYGVSVTRIIDRNRYVTRKNGNVLIPNNLRLVSDQMLISLKTIAEKHDTMSSSLEEIIEEIMRRRKVYPDVQEDIVMDHTTSAPIIHKFMLRIYDQKNYSEREVVQNSYFSLTNSSQTGYAFKGWYLDRNYKKRLVSQIMPGNDLSVYAKWIVNEYQLSYQTGSNEFIKNTKVKYGDKIKGATGYQEKLHKEGHTFAGWYLDNAYTRPVRESAMPAKATTLYAKWMINEYQLSYQTGSNEFIKNTKVKYGDKIKGATGYQEKLHKEGHTFAGWYLDKAYTRPVSESTMPANDTTLYAKWMINEYQLSYQTGSNESIQTTKVKYESKIKGATGYQEKLHKEGHTFAGWYLDKAYTRLVSESTMPANDTTLYAKWMINEYQLSYQTGSNESIQTTKVKYGSKIKDATGYQEKLYKEGHTFAGWYLDNAYIRPVSESTMPANDTTLYAKWTVNEYQLSYQTGSNVSIQTTKVKYGDKIKDAEGYKKEIKKESHLFDGWYLDDTCIHPVGESTMLAKDTTLYAKWSPSAVLTMQCIDENGVQIGSVVGIFFMDFRIDTEVDTSKLIPSLIDGYIFTSEWYKSKDLSDTNKITTFIMPKDKYTIYAKMKKI